MRVTFNMLSLKYLSNLSSSLEKVTNANEKVVKGRNLLAPESDVVYYASSLNVQRTIDEGQQFSRNAENAISWLSNYENELQRAFDIIRNAKNEYAIAGANASQNSVSRKALAGDVSNLLQQLVDVGNANYFGRYFFSGYKTDTKAFASDKREVSAVKITSDGDILKRNVFADLPELKEGNYKLEVTSMGSEYISIVLKDAKGSPLIIDSNGSDESGKGGNLAGTQLKVKFRPNEVVNLGVGIAVKLPTSNTSFTASFYYKPGDDINYMGDKGQITTKIGYQQDVTINFTGQEVFTEVERILKGTRYNTIKGLQITETTKFSQFDGANISLADYIEVSGTDHNGLKVGTAKIRGIDIVNLDMTNVSSSDRTFNLEYAGKIRSITLDARSYKDIDDVIFSINREIETLGWAEEIEAKADGDRILISTTRSGNAVKLKLTATEQNPFGFPTTIEETGRDTTFELSYDNFDNTSPLSLSFSSVFADAQVDIYLDNKLISIPASAGRTLTSLVTQLNNQLQNMKLDAIYNFRENAGNLIVEKTNIDFTNTTALSVRLNDGTNNLYKTATPRKVGYPSANEKSVSDLLRFIENLYDNTVDARLEDGKIVVSDKRGGPSKFTLKLIPSNSGIGYPEVEPKAILKGKYTGGMDDEWIVSMTSSGIYRNITIMDKNNNIIKVINNIDTTTYNGGEVDLGYGVKMVLPGETTGVVTPALSFKLQLKASSSLSFGDMNIVQEGKNVNTFRSLKNLYDALNLDIPKEGIGAPSAWRDDKFKSTMKPYLDGTFRGNYNDQWTYEVLTQDKKTSFYLQKELSTSSISEIATAGSVNFDILLKDKDGNMIRESFSNVQLANLIEEINSPLRTNLYKNGVKAELVNNKLVIRSGSGTQEVELTPTDQNSAQLLGYSVMYNHDNDLNTPDISSNYRTIFSKNQISYNLSNATDAQRTLSFNYYDGTNWNSTSIKIDKKDYTGLDDLIDEINSKIASTPSIAGRITAVNINNQLSFQFNNTINNLLISGDNEGTLGFFKAGDTLKIKVSNSKGELINTLTFDTANKLKYVADGVKLSFNTGIAYATDSFSSTVGSGINYEIGILDKAENQINEKLTIAGTRYNRAESVVNFQATLKTVSETVKAKYLGSRSEDATAAITEFQLAQQAYQAALATSTKLMQLSILDYIR
ncbi:MAG: hypothetical protein N3C60_02985 [Calditerrivibrio sp.]|nr:hypothetical protein [Calditerrivibrio sp.]